jgi:hypothetical protein
MLRLQPLFPKIHGTPRADDLHVLSDIVFTNRDGPMCRRNAIYEDPLQASDSMGGQRYLRLDDGGPCSRGNDFEDGAD